MPLRADAIQAIVDRLRVENEAQENTLRGLREVLHVKSFSSHSSMRITNAVSTPSLFYVPSERRWNQELQDICAAAPMDVMAKVSAVNAFVAEFEREMTRLGEVFIDQYLGESDAVLQQESDPLPHGITIALLDCEDRHAVSIAAKEQRAQLQLLSQQIGFLHMPIICVYPRVTLTFKGRLMVLSAEPSTQTDPTPIVDCAELRCVMGLVSETLGMAPYHVSVEAGDDRLTCGPPNASVIRGADGRLYAHNLLGLLPFFPPARGTAIDVSKHKVHLRMELLNSLHQGTRLSPGAFRVFGAQDSCQANVDVRAAVARLCQSTIPKLAGSFAASPPPTPKDVLARMHSVGANAALLPLLYTHVKKLAPASRGPAMVWTEMVARVVRDLVLLDMSRRIDTAEIIESIGETLAQLMDVEFFESTVAPRLREKFVGMGSLFKEMPTMKEVDVAALVVRVGELSGFDLDGEVSKNALSEGVKIKRLRSLTKGLRLPTPVYERLAFDELSTMPPPSARDQRGEGLEGRATLDQRPGTLFTLERYISGREHQISKDPVSTTLSTLHHNPTYVLMALDLAQHLNHYKVLCEKAEQVASSGLDALRDSPLCSQPELLRGLLLLERGRARARTKADAATRLAIADLGCALHIFAPHVVIPFLEIERSTKDRKVDQITSGTAYESAVSDSEAPSVAPQTFGSVHGAATAEELFRLCQQVHDIQDLVPILEYAYEELRNVYGPADARVASLRKELRHALVAVSDSAKAEELLREEVEAGADPARGCEALMAMSELMLKDGRLAECAESLKQCVAKAATHFGAVHAVHADAKIRLGVCHLAQNFLPEADAQLTGAVAMLRRMHGSTMHPDVGNGLVQLGKLRRLQQRHDEARACWQEALQCFEGSGTRNDARLVSVMALLQQDAARAQNAAEEAQWRTRIAELQRSTK